MDKSFRESDHNPEDKTADRQEAGKTEAASDYKGTIRRHP